ncbi:MAG: UvrD-helicase domain-containing protein [Muribaculaceae bacterium]|nr:UvrD-helicase domain-containing protein [Muribaculaceae bacterium]
MNNIPDTDQSRAVEFFNGTALILAGPGCGKTHVLAKRVFHASRLGIDFKDMLCVTFTNRAAREMKHRIHEYLGYDPAGLFAGNLHRFCLRFLMENELVSPDISILDEDDRDDYIRSLLPDECHTQDNIQQFKVKAAYVYQLNNNHPYWTLRHPRCEEITDDELRLIEMYEDFKKDFSLIDFDDILLQTLTALNTHPRGSLKYTEFRWVQVDEVQDMTPLQLSIIDSLTRTADRTLVYFGDEQQAIFNFLGAGGRALEFIKQSCRGNILHLGRNYRSPRQLVEACNTFAVEELGLDPQFLSASYRGDGNRSTLRLMESARYAKQEDAAYICRQWLLHDEGTCAVLARTNAEAERLSEYFHSIGLPHFLVSRLDVFHQVPFRTVWSHLAAVSQPFRPEPWARLLYQTHSVRTMAQGRSVVRLLREAAVAYDELLCIDESTRVERFVDVMESNRTVVVFDTETTGLDVLTDDIVQIAAVKMRGGEIVEGSEFNIFIRTTKRLPELLRDETPNPLLRIYDHAEKHEPADALKAFFDYAGSDSVIAGHNLNFDIAILRENVRRHIGEKIVKSTGNTTDESLEEQLSRGLPENFENESLDTLDIARLLFPMFPAHTLAHMTAALRLEVKNTHIATDDALATAVLAQSLVDLAQTKVRLIKEVRDRIHRISDRFREHYASFYNYWRRIYCEPDNKHDLMGAMQAAATFFADKGYTKPIAHFDYVLRLIDRCVVDPREPYTFRSQVSAHLFDLISYNEADLYLNGIVDERLSVMTIHKAKGLEMDNVLVYNANSGFGTHGEQARLLYVAMSRAKQRLAIAYSDSLPKPLQSIAHFFH